MMKKVNYHTHTMRCNHAFNTDEEMVLAAIKGGYRELGFSDHACWKYDSDFKSRIRMELWEFDGYYESIQYLKEKYKDQIQIYVGLECEYYPKYMGWLETFVKEKKLDYIILGNHYDTSDEYGQYYGMACGDDRMFRKYIDDCIAGMSTGLYSYLAHPDLFVRGRSHFDRLACEESERLCRWCKDHHVVMEYNLEGIRLGQERNMDMYPKKEFWEIAAKIGNRVMIGVDAHMAESLENSRLYEEAVEKLEDMGLKVETELPRKF